VATLPIHTRASSLGSESRGRTGKASSARAHARHPATVQRILCAAEEIFAERGLAGARTGAIARAARVNPALLYYYFQSKEELHGYTLNVLFQQLRAQVSEALEQAGSPRERLLRYVNTYFDFMAKHPNYPRLFQRQLIGGGPSLSGMVNEYFRPLHRRLTATIREGISGGEFRRVDPEHTVLSVIAMTVFYFSAAPVLAELWKCDPLTPQRIAARRRAILDFMEHGLFLRRADGAGAKKEHAAPKGGATKAARKR
jgi:TetR/AcrR family transcriptional regulator